MNVNCSAKPCPVILDAVCVFYSGSKLIYTGIKTNDNLEIILEKIDGKFKDAAIGYIFSNGIIQAFPGQPVKLGGKLVENTTIDSDGFTFKFTGTIESQAFITTGGTASQFVKGDGSLDSTSYQTSGNYITALTGDGTASGPGVATFALSNSGVIANTYGSASQVPVITVDAKGRITNVTDTPINYPPQLLFFSGDVGGAGQTGSNVTLTLNNVNSNVFPAITPLKFAVNAKGLVTAAAALTNLDIFALIGYTPVPQTRTLTINGVTYDLSANRSWSFPVGGGTVTNVSVTSGVGISASVTNPTTTPNITITNTAPDQTVVINSGTGISVTGSYPTFTISNTQTSAQWGNITGTITAQTDLISYLSTNYVPKTRNLTINGVTYDLSADRSWTITAGVSSVTASAPLSSSGGSTPNISITQANGSTNGYLSSTDWTTFNNKQDTITLTTIGSSGAATFIANTLNIPQYTDQFLGTVTSVGLSMPSAFTVTNSPVTSSGTLTVTGAGLADQYIRGDGTLANFPANVGGGSSVSYYLNGSVNQGTFGGNVYHELSRTPIIGTGTNFTINTNGYIAQFITDAGDPALLNIPGGNWDFQIYFSASSSGGSPQFYAELYKYDGTNFTLISSGSTSPQNISFGTFADVYSSTLTVPQTALTITDRLAVRIYVIHSGRTITLYTEDNKLAEVHTTFSTGLAALNGLTAQVQYFAVGTTGTDFGISSVTDTHTFNLPVASSSNTGKLSSTDWSTFNNKPTVYYQNTAPTGTGTSSIVLESMWTHSDTGLQYVYVYDGNTYQWIQATLPLGPQGPQGASGTNTINASTATTFNGLLKGNGATISATTVLTEIGYTPENQANKENTTLDTSATKYPTNNLVKTSLDAFSDDVDYAIMTNQRLLFNF